MIDVGLVVGLWSAWAWAWVSRLWVCDFGLWLVWAWVSGSWVCDFGLWSAWVSGLWVWVVVGHGVVDRRDGFAFVEVCCGGFVCVCVCVLLVGVMGLPLCLSYIFSSIWVLWLWWWLICDLEEEGSGWAFFFFFFFVARMDMGLLGWDGSVWVCWIDRWVWVVGFFFQWWWMGWVWVCCIEIVKFAGLSVTEEERERN